MLFRSAYKQYSQMTWPHCNDKHPILFYIKDALTSGGFKFLHHTFPWYLLSPYPHSADALSSPCFSSSLYSQTSNILIQKPTAMVAIFLEKLPCTIHFRSWTGASGEADLQWWPIFWREPKARARLGSQEHGRSNMQGLQQGRARCLPWDVGSNKQSGVSVRNNFGCMVLSPRLLEKTR